MLSRRSLLRAALGAAGASAIASACGDRESTEDAERPLTNEEAGWLAGILLDNLDRGGARFGLTVGAPGGADSMARWIGPGTPVGQPATGEARRPTSPR